MNLGQRIAGALSALSGSLSQSVEANTTADSTFREQMTAALAATGLATTALKTQLDALEAQVANGATIDPAQFAEIKATVDSLNAAFPDEDQLDPLEDDAENPIVDQTGFIADN